MSRALHPRDRRRSVAVAFVLCLLALIAVVALAWRHGAAPAQADADAPPTTLGAHALVGQEQGRLDPVVRTPPLAVAERGSSLVAFVAGYAANDAVPTDNRGNRWRRLGSPVFYRSYDNRFDVRAYLALQAHGGVDHRVEQAKHARPDGEATLVVIEARNAGRLVDAAQAYPRAGLRVASGSVTTDGPALLVALWFGDGDGLRQVATATDGFRVVERFTLLPPGSAVQAVAAVREVERAGTYRVHWYAAPPQGAILWLLAFARPLSPAPAPAAATPHPAPAGTPRTR